METSVVYIDESGNSGDVAGQAATLLAQPTFVLAGVVEDEQAGAADEVVRRVRVDYKLQAKDLKWKSFAKKPRALVALVRALREMSIVPFAELMSKRHYLASNLMTYLLGRRRVDYSDERQLAIANACADLLSVDVGHEALLAYAALSKAPTPEKLETVLLLLRVGIHNAIEEERIPADRVPFAAFADHLVNDVVREWHSNCTSERLDLFVQEPDTSLGGHRLGLLPQVQAFSNLVARVNMHQSGRHEVCLVHDEQSEFGPLIRQYFELLITNRYAPQLSAHTTHAKAPVSWDFSGTKFTLRFDDSAHCAGIQIADVLAGFCRSKLDAALLGETSDELLNVAACELGEFSAPTGLLLQATTEQVRTFFGAES